jgi:hypothetical protein
MNQVMRSLPRANFRAANGGALLSQAIRLPLYCKQRNDLLDKYVAAASAHGRAVEELRTLLEAGLQDQFRAMAKITLEAVARCEIAGREFASHRKVHGCC